MAKKNSGRRSQQRRGGEQLELEPMYPYTREQALAGVVKPQRVAYPKVRRVSDAKSHPSEQLELFRCRPDLLHEVPR